MPEPVQVYKAASATGPLRQGEILASVHQYLVTPIVGLEGEPARVSNQVKVHPLAVVLTQDCDLAQDYSARNAPAPNSQRLLLPNVLLCEMDLADNMKGGGSIAPGSDIWKRIIQNKDERFHFLTGVDIGCDALGIGTAALLCDLKKIFSVPTDALYQQVSTIARRRAVLVSPYLEHLSSRHAYFLSRIALPLDHA